ncbi:MAG: tRNA lysidine(34) synthetase TilS [Pirellulales bacterium]
MIPFEQRLLAVWPSTAWQDVGVVLAVSGGADSVALARVVAALKSGGPGRLTIAHFNHRLRGAESDGDQQFVQTLAQQLGLNCLVGPGEIAQPGSMGDGDEAAARHARYDFLQHVAEAVGARYVVTAHTADDQAETVLHHVLRGSGLAGLAAMARTRPLGPAVTLVRPLLAFRRRELLDYLAELHQPYREDTSNLDLRFARNRIRHELLPLIEREYRSTAVEALVRLATLAGDAQRLVDAAASDLLDRAIAVSAAGRATLDCRLLSTADRHLVREVFVTLWRRQAWPMQDMGYAEWDALAGMARGELGDSQRVFPGAITARKVDEQFELHASAEKPIHIKDCKAAAQA